MAVQKEYKDREVTGKSVFDNIILKWTEPCQEEHFNVLPLILLDSGIVHINE